MDNGPAPDVLSGKNSWCRRIASESDDYEGIEATQQTAGLQIATPKTKERNQFRPISAACDSGRVDTVHVEFTESTVESFTSAVGDKHKSVSAVQQLHRQRLSRENMTAGAAGRQNNRARHFGHAVAPARIRVNANKMPIPKANARSDEPP
tara:strand:- start:38 stop:490 length:453 start_codon:yes stop_codon:yes gene_type:complete